MTPTDAELIERIARRVESIDPECLAENIAREILPLVKAATDIHAPHCWIGEGSKIRMSERELCPRMSEQQCHGCDAVDTLLEALCPWVG